MGDEQDDQQAKLAALKAMLQVSPNDVNKIVGTSKIYPDTGQQASNPSDVADSYVGAPIRQAIGQMQQGNFSGAPSAALQQMGNSPSSAPSGQDLMQNAGLSGMPAQVAGGALDAATNPSSYMGNMGAGGVAGTVEKKAAVEAPLAFQKVQQMFQAGNKTFPAANAAEAMKIKQALENAGMIKPTTTLVKK